MIIHEILVLPVCIHALNCTGSIVASASPLTFAKSTAALVSTIAPRINDILRELMLDPLSASKRIRRFLQSQEWVVPGL